MRYGHDPAVSWANGQTTTARNTSARPITAEAKVESHVPNEVIHSRQDRSKRCSATIANATEPAFWDAAAEAHATIDAAYN
jgi:hypothetical protein